jgi:hypothetical protein
MNALRSNHQALAQRAQVLTSTVNQLIADIESDVSAPEGAAFNAKVAYDALKGVYFALLGEPSDARSHYEDMAREAVTGDRLPDGRVVLATPCAWRGGA